jgi:hypothetical protein
MSRFCSFRQENIYQIGILQTFVHMENKESELVGNIAVLLQFNELQICYVLYVREHILLELHHICYQISVNFGLYLNMTNQILIVLAA